MKLGAKIGHFVSEETKKKISLSKIGIHNKNIHKGWKHTEEWKKNMSNKMKIIMNNPIMKDKVSNFHKNRKRSLETRNKISKNHSHYWKGVKKINSLESIEKMKIERKKQILPTKDTTIEIKIQNFLRKLNIEYLTHQYLNIKHDYQCDIFIPSLNLIIECDGDYWHKYPIGTEKDKIRTLELIEKGFKVLRLWEHEIRKMEFEDFRFEMRCQGLK